MKPTAIVVHCSASKGGDSSDINAWHIARGWSGIGYHAVILNGRRHIGSPYDAAIDGKIEPGRADNVMGAHCAAGGMNTKALGVCLIGLPGWQAYTERQLAALVHWCAVKCKAHGISPSAITQHSDHDKGKPLCASVDLIALRAAVTKRLAA